MLVSRRDGALKLVTQPDHGRVAGALAQHWGNDDFASAALREELLYVAAYHDDAWQHLDAAPQWNEDAKRPAHFLELPLPVVAAEFQKAIDATCEARPVAGAILSAHFTGFYRSRWGVDDAPFVDHPAVPEIVEHQENRRARAIRESWPTDRPRADFEREVWHAYEILQVHDLLSLCLCLIDLDRESDSEAQVMARTLFSIDQRPTRRIILRAPKNDFGERVDLTVSVAAPGVVAVAPYPFASSEVTVEIPMRVLEDKPYPSADEAAAAFQDAAVETRQVSIVGEIDKQRK